MQERTYKIRGISPIIFHNEQLSDPLNKWTIAIREISSKKKKTDADLAEMSRREWFGGLYTNRKDQVVVPGKNLERMIRDAATKSKMGKAVQAGTIVPGDFLLDFPDKSKSPKALWDSESYFLRASCKVGQSRVIRTRPMFEIWSLEFTVMIDEEVVSPKLVDEFVTLAGRIIGLCDWRPKHGRFEVEEIR